MRDQPEQQAPPVQRLRIRYAKRGRLRFTSHRDFSRAFERAVFRARIPMAYSSGFNPHPRISYAGAAPTGSASEAEYLEIGLAEVVDPAGPRARSTRRCPPASTCSRSWSRPAGRSPTCSRRSRWRIDLAARPATCAAAVAAFLAADAVLVERMTKKGLREFDCRGRGALAGGRRRARAVRARPGAAAHRARGPPRRRADRAGGRGRLDAGEAPLLTRLAQGPLDPETGAVGDPLAPRS